MGGQGPSDVWGQLDQQNATSVLEIRPECKRGSGHTAWRCAYEHPSYYKPVHLSFSRKHWQGEPPSSLIYSLMMPQLVVLTRIQI